RWRDAPARLEAGAEVSVLVARAAQSLRRAGPSRLDADVELQKDLGPEQPFHLAPRVRPDLLQARAALADHDRLLAVPLHQHAGGDADQAALPRLALRLVELLDQHRGAVGPFLPGTAQALLPD